MTNPRTTLVVFAEERGNELIVRTLLVPVQRGMTEVSRVDIGAVDRTSLWRAVDSISSSYSADAATHLVDTLYEESAFLFNKILDSRGRKVLSNSGAGAQAVVVASDVPWIPWELFLLEPDRKRFLADVTPVIRLPVDADRDPDAAHSPENQLLVDLVHVAHPKHVSGAWRTRLDVKEVSSLGQLLDVTKTAKLVHLMGHNDSDQALGMRLNDQVYYSTRSVQAFRFPEHSFVQLSACHGINVTDPCRSLGSEVVKYCRCTVLATACLLPLEEGWRIAAYLHEQIKARPKDSPSSVWQDVRRSPDFLRDFPFSRCFLQFGNADSAMGGE